MIKENKPSKLAVERESALNYYINQMLPDDLYMWRKLNKLRLVSACIGKRYVVYNFDSEKSPIIGSIVTIDDIVLNGDDGFTYKLRDEKTGDVQLATYVPERLFGYAIFIAVPSHVQYNTVLQRNNEGDVVRKFLSFAILVKFAAGECQIGSTYIEPLSHFYKLYPDIAMAYAA